MKISIDKSSKVPVYLQIADQIKAQIISGALPRSSALPSERALAQILDVHRNTVVKAYGELKSDAWIESRQGVGYLVASASTEKSRSARAARACRWGALTGSTRWRISTSTWKRPLTICSSGLRMRAIFAGQRHCLARGILI